MGPGISTKYSKQVLTVLIVLLILVYVAAMSQ